MTAEREGPTVEADMPQVFLLLYGAALAAPLLLFAILIATGLERRLDLRARERLVRARIMHPRVAPAAALTLVVIAPAPVTLPRQGRTAA
jgi:hypothetical protein